MEITNWLPLKTISYLRYKEEIKAFFICSIIALSLFFNSNGIFWDSIFNSYYNLFFITVIGVGWVVAFNDQMVLNKLDVALLTLLIWSFISRLLNAPFLSDIHSLFTLCLIIFYLILKTIKWNSRILIRFISFITLFGFMLAIIGILQYYEYIESEHSQFLIVGTFFNPGPYGGFLALIFPVSVFIIGLTCKKKKWLFAVIGVLMSVAISWAVILSQSRSALFSLIISSLIPIIYHLNIRLKRKHILIGIFFLIVSSAIVIFLSHKGWESISGRFLIWKISFNIFKTNPLFGIGSQFFEVEYGKFQIEYFLSGKASKTEYLLAGENYYAFNEIIKFLVENGLAGLIILGIIIFQFFRSYRTFFEGNLSKAVSISVLVSALIFALFAYPLYFICFKLLILVSVSIYANSLKTAWEPNRIAVKAIILTLSTVIIFFASKSFNGYKNWELANLTNWSDFSTVNHHFLNAQENLQSNGQFFYNYGQFMEEYDSAKSIRLYEYAAIYFTSKALLKRTGLNYAKLGWHKEAEHQLLKAYYIKPGLLSPQETLMDYYLSTGNNKMALFWATKILTTEPKFVDYRSKKIKGKAHATIEILKRNLINSNNSQLKRKEDKLVETEPT